MSNLSRQRLRKVSFIVKLSTDELTQRALLLLNKINIYCMPLALPTDDLAHIEEVIRLSWRNNIAILVNNPKHGHRRVYLSGIDVRYIVTSSNFDRGLIDELAKKLELLTAEEQEELTMLMDEDDRTQALIDAANDLRNAQDKFQIKLTGSQQAIVDQALGRKPMVPAAKKPSPLKGKKVSSKTNQRDPKDWDID